ncbi:ribosome-associated translation inhibitor RaiA [Verticiella sediminum]|uniref:Ribosome hibernation promoting factor n=1 Tax=Verticiella sediminum TaxID=1247510 RepID=A0A556AB70_9BURK|nr:ribosome-associated translation inhibitor RaiA [Verticiella sediminum]TSH90132.1 ribosome-associated translation inhibitor RaiA [Verticiella sediminum]
MNLSISGHQLEVTPAIREYVTNKLDRVLRHFDHIIDAQVILSAAKLRHTADVTVRVPGKDIHCEATDENLYAAIDLLIDKLDRQVVKYKNKVQAHAPETIKRNPLAPDTVEAI